MRVTKATRAIATLAAAVVASAVSIAVQATPAAAATICSAYTNGEIWQTSARWGRVQERLCLYYTGTTVRGQVTIQVDYPYTCTLSVGLPPTVGVSCPDSTSYKSANLDLHGTKWRVGFKRGSSATVWTRCEAGVWDGPNRGTMSRTCSSPIYADSYSSYRVYASDVMGDVKDDGEGWKVLAPEDWPFSSP